KAQKMVQPGFFSSTIWVWDATTGKELCQIKSKQPPGRGDKDGKVQQVVEGVDYPAGLALSPDGKRLAVLYSDGRIALLDATTGKKLVQIGNKTAAAAPGAVAASGPAGLLFAPDGKSLLTIHFDTDVQKQAVLTYLQAWDAATGKQLHKVASVGGEVGVAPLVSPDSKTVAWGDGDKEIRLFDAASGKEVQKLEVASGRATAYCFSPDGKLLYVRSGKEQTIGVWELKAINEVSRLRQGGAQE